MRLSGIQRPLLLGTMCMITSLNHAETAARITPSLESQPAPVMEAGSRLFMESSAKNEFYILGKNQPEPVRKGPVYVNTKPLISGMDKNNILGAGPSEAIAETNNVLQEPSANTKIEAQPEKANPDASVPVHSKASTNLSKVKNILHSMTRKIAVKNKHSRARMASSGKLQKLKGAKHKQELLPILRTGFIG